MYKMRYIGYARYADDTVNDREGYCRTFSAQDEYDLHCLLYRMGTNVEDAFVYDIENKRELSNKEIFDLTVKDSFTYEECRYSYP